MTAFVAQRTIDLHQRGQVRDCYSVRPNSMDAARPAIPMLWENKMPENGERRSASTGTPPQPLSAGAFRNLLNAFERLRVPLVPGEAHAAAERQRQQLIGAIEGHQPDVRWRNLLHEARHAAERGQHEYLLLRFPSDACSDQGRAILQHADDWAGSLTGDPGALYRYWAENLQSAGFSLSARVLEFSREGIPGDMGLFLQWQEGSTRASEAAPGGATASAAADRPQARTGQMKAILLLTAGGPLLVLTSYASALDAGLLGKLAAKGVRKFVAFDAPLELVKQRYSTHFVVVAHDLHETDDLRVLDFDGPHVFQLLRFDELGAPILHEG